MTPTKPTDTQRLDWLESGTRVINAGPLTYVFKGSPGAEPLGVGATLRAAIDAAMEAEQDAD